MKGSQEVAIAVALAAVVAVRIYKKYFSKDNQAGPGTGKKPGSFQPSSKEDEYEPYSKK